MIIFPLPIAISVTPRDILRPNALTRSHAGLVLSVNQRITLLVIVPIKLMGTEDKNVTVVGMTMVIMKEASDLAVGAVVVSAEGEIVVDTGVVVETVVDSEEVEVGIVVEATEAVVVVMEIVTVGVTEAVVEDGVDEGDTTGMSQINRVWSSELVRD